MVSLALQIKWCVLSRVCAHVYVGDDALVSVGWVRHAPDKDPVFLALCRWCWLLQIDPWR